MSRAVSARPSRRLVVASVLALAMGLLIASAPSAFPSTQPSKVDARVAQQIKAHGSADFWILFKQKANLSKAYRIRNWTDRGWYVVNNLKATANSSQRSVRSLLAARGASFQSFWIQNGIKVTGGAASLVNAVASRPEVSRIAPDWSAKVVAFKGTAIPTGLDGVEWGIKNIKAKKVWKKFKDRGEGTVVASIDTGVQYNHPALVNAYRGNLGGSFNHNYNWFDPTNLCPSSGDVPCDNNGHGTHTMGTMVGLAGGNKIGVAPNAKWIAAKGCETSSCSSNALLSAGQWILAPTDVNGNNPDASKRPDVVNNSWGGGRGDTWYQATVTAWVASGIFPQFANGNAGPACSTAGDPGEYVNAYAAGAYDINNNIASFSSRGPSFFSSEIKPNISAPGVNVRSSWNNGGYMVESGTSMASPHVAGTVALIISKNSALRGNISAIRTILDNSGIDVNSLGCGGSLDDNNNFGEGRLNALSAVQAALAFKQG